MDNLAVEHETKKESSGRSAADRAPAVVNEIQDTGSTPEGTVANEIRDTGSTPEWTVVNEIRDTGSTPEGAVANESPDAGSTPEGTVETERARGTAENMEREQPVYPGAGHVRIRHLEMKAISQEDIDRVLELTGQLEAFETLMMYYDCALAEVRTKLEVLNKEVSLKKNRNPFESIKSRLKKPVSIYEKLKLRRISFSVENIEKYLTDVAGLRVICSFIDDIYSIRDSLAAQDDVLIIEEKDYIAHPKQNGYRSLHLILEVPIFLMQEKKYMRVELQFRTIAMDFWASVEHKMKYKKEIRNEESIAEELRYSADLINQLDRRMLQIRDRIELSEEGDLVMSEWR